MFDVACFMVPTYLPTHIGLHWTALDCTVEGGKYGIYEDQDDLDSAMDRDSFGQHLRRQQDEDPRHSLDNDDPFSHDDSFVHHESFSENDITFESSHSHSNEEVEREESSADNTFRTRYSRGISPSTSIHSCYGYVWYTYTVT